MRSAVDTSVLIAALDASDPDHDGSREVLLSGRCVVHSHALTEAFSTLTGGRLAIRLSAADATSILKVRLAPKLYSIVLTERDLLAAFEETSRRGVRGGAIHDYLHLFAARKAGAERLYTLNTADFQAFHRAGDPVICHP
jgi:predicted nucleic acid-binding protein